MNLINRLRFKDYLILFVICCLGFWQITFFVNIMKWDILDINLPWRYFISECLQNGILPLWNPYINCGFPQSADPMTWYPLSWIIGFLFGNNLLTLQYEYLFHIFIGGIGIYKLVSLLKFNKETKLIASIAFMFSGVFISNAQHFGWIVSAGWFPLIIYQYILFCKELKIQNGLYFIVFTFFSFTGGYIGFFIITIYILFAIFIYFLIKYRRNHFKQYIVKNFIISVLLTLLSSVVIISFFDISKLLTRYGQLSLEYVTSDSLPLKSLISFLVPFATTTDIHFWGLDLSLINSYMGVCLLPFIVYALINIKNKKVKIIFFIGIFFLSTAITDIFPFRKWLYYLPFMNIFRFPVIFRFFGYFALILVSSFGINHFFKTKSENKSLKIILYSFIVLLLILFIYNSFFVEKWKFKKLLTFDFITFFNVASINDRIFLQSLIQIVVLSGFLVAISKFKNKARNIVIIALVAFDMILATQLNIYQTVIDSNSPKATQQAIVNLPDQFPIPDMNKRVVDINDKTSAPIPFLWRNLTVFYKTPSYSGYSPYYFSSMYKSECSGQFFSVIKNPIFYLADSINQNNIIDSLSIDSLSSKKILITGFNPNKVELSVNCEKPNVLTYVQNYYPGWEVYLNNKKIDIIVTNYTFMSVFIPEGENKVSFKFNPRRSIVAFVVSYLTLFLLFICLIVVETTKYIKR